MYFYIGAVMFFFFLIVVKKYWKVFTLYYYKIKFNRIMTIFNTYVIKKF